MTRRMRAYAAERTEACFARTLQGHALVNGCEREALAINGEQDRGIADQILDFPAILGAPPDLDVAVLACHQEDLLDRGELAVVRELDPRSWAAVEGESTSTMSLGSATARAPRSAGAQVTTRTAWYQVSARSAGMIPASTTTRQGGFSLGRLTAATLATMVPCASIGGAMATGRPSISS